jgi:hypothetical protein
MPGGVAVFDVRLLGEIGGHSPPYVLHYSIAVDSRFAIVLGIAARPQSARFSPRESTTRESAVLVSSRANERDRA